MFPRWTLGLSAFYFFLFFSPSRLRWEAEQRCPSSCFSPAPRTVHRTTPIHFSSGSPAGQKAKLLPEVVVIHTSSTEFTPLACQPHPVKPCGDQLTSAVPCRRRKRGALLQKLAHFFSQTSVALTVHTPVIIITISGQGKWPNCCTGIV